MFILSVTAGMIVSGCGSPKTTGNEESPLENAITLYIEGDLTAAELVFTDVTQQQSSPEDLQTAYLYLGRIYMAWGDYDRAAEAFSSGRVLGGDIRFEEYFELAKTRAGVSPERASAKPRLTRGELAALIHMMFGDALGVANEAGSPARTATDTERESNRAPAGVDAAETVVGRGETIDAVTATGVMRVLPDGEFHRDAPVTRPAFYMIATRLASRLAVDAGVMDAMFPGGYRAIVGEQQTHAGGDGDPSYVTGREVVDCFERIKNAAGL